MKWIKFDDHTFLNMDLVESIEIIEDFDSFALCASTTDNYYKIEGFKTAEEAKQEAKKILKDFGPYGDL